MPSPLPSLRVTARLRMVGEQSVRSWWNRCLYPSFRPSCRCIHTQPHLQLRSSPSSPLPSLSSSALLRLLGRSTASLASALPSRTFSSASLTPATSASSTTLPSFPSPSASASAPSSFPNSSSSPPLSEAVQLTDAAAARIVQLRGKHGQGMRLRLSVDSGGCSGLSYKFDIDKDGQQEDDCEFRHGEGAVLVDRVSLALLKGSVIDYTVKIERSGFEVLNNPNSVAKCGCGTSFQPKHF